MGAFSLPVDAYLGVELRENEQIDANPPEERSDRSPKWLRRSRSLRQCVRVPISRQYYYCLFFIIAIPVRVKWHLIVV